MLDEYSIDRVKLGRKRGVVSLVSASNKKVNAGVKYAGLKEKSRNDFLARITHWVDGGQPFPHYHHGWDSSQYGGRYTDCYVFKIKSKTYENRFYGFLCHPVIFKPDFVLCVLVIHTIKKQFATYEPDLKRTKEFSANNRVQSAVDGFARLQGGVGNEWKC